MKKITLLIFLIISHLSYSQNPSALPPLIRMEGKQIDSSDVFVIGNFYQLLTHIQYASGYSCNSISDNLPNPNNLVLQGNVFTFNNTPGIDNPNLNIVSADLDNDGYDEIITFAPRNGTMVNVLVGKQTAPASYSFTVTNPITVPGTLCKSLNPNNSGNGKMVVGRGNFDNDITDEIYLTFRDSITWEVKYYIFDGNGTTNLQQIYSGSPGATWIGAEGVGATAYDVDADGIDELGIVYTGVDPSSGYDSTFLSTYKFNEGNAILARRDLVSTNINYNNYPVFYTLAAEDFNWDGREELVLAASCSRNNQYYDGWLFILRVTDDLTTQNIDYFEKFETYTNIAPATISDPGTNLITLNSSVAEPNNIQFTVSPTVYASLTLKCGNVNGSSTPEIVLGTSSGSIYIFKVDNQFNIRAHATYNNFDNLHYAPNYWSVIPTRSNCFMELVDVDKNAVYEIATITTGVDANNVDLTNLRLLRNVGEGYGGTQLLSERPDIFSNSTYNVLKSGNVALLSGNFKSQRFKVGRGVFSKITDINQPLVILNAPPTHFDIIDGETYDVNGCFAGNGCDFNSTYFTQNSINTNISTTLSSDWGVSGTVGVGGGALGFDVKAYATATYGEQFENTQSSSQTISVSTQISATTDDQIFSSVTDYDIWEYPLTRNGVLKGFMMSMTPVLTYNSWAPSKQWVNFKYIPNHEVGNILSYKNYAQLNQNPDASTKLKGDYGNGSSFALSPNIGSTADWSFLYADVSSQSQNLSKSIGLEVGLEVSGWGVEAAVSGSYNQNEMSTQESTIENTMQMSMHLGELGGGVPEPGYRVTPYVYWAKNGALVLDYACEPDIPTQGGTATFWSDKYTIQDPAWLMPWRYDPEKGFPLVDTLKRYQTKSIVFSPSRAQEGDTVKLTAFIHNLSLQPTDLQIPVQFFFGNPANGNIISSLSGQTTFNLPIIGVRDRDTISFDFIMPPANVSKRVFGVIDPQNSLVELHKNNNVAWAVIGNNVDDSLTSYKPVIAVNNTESAIYPNPVNENTALYLTLTDAGPVSIELFDINGRLIQTIVNKISMPAANYSFPINISQLSNQLYLVKVNAGAKSKVHKLIVAR